MVEALRRVGGVLHSTSMDDSIVAEAVAILVSAAEAVVVAGTDERGYCRKWNSEDDGEARRGTISCGVI